MKPSSIDPHLLERYFLDACSVAEAFEVEQWLASGEKEDADIELLCDIFDRIDIRNDAMADKAFERCADVLNIGAVRQGRSPLLTVLAVVAMAACFFLGVLLHRKEALVAPLHFTEVYAQRGSSEKVTLPDGSTIHLKSGSSLIYPSEFVGDTREVFLSGECYASIAKDRERPFIMTTRMMNVRVTGTEFNIKSFPEDSEAEVALVEGNVQLEGRRGGDTPLQSIQLAPGNVVKVDRNNGETRISEFNVNSYVSQQEGGDVFVFLDRRLCDIVSELSRRFDVSIVLHDKSLGEKRFYSSFVNGESLDQMLATFNADGSMVIREDAGVIRISKRGL